MCAILYFWSERLLLVRGENSHWGREGGRKGRRGHTRTRRGKAEQINTSWAFDFLNLSFLIYFFIFMSSS